MASPRKSERLISSRDHGCFTISPPQLPATATRVPSHGSGRPGLVLQTATKLSSVGFEPTAVLTFGLRVRRLNHSATRYTIAFTLFFYKKLVYKKLVLRWPKFQETLVLCLRSTKKLFKVRSMDFIVNRSLSHYHWVTLSLGNII